MDLYPKGVSKKALGICPTGIIWSHFFGIYNTIVFLQIAVPVCYAVSHCKTKTEYIQYNRFVHSQVKKSLNSSYGVFILQEAFDSLSGTKKCLRKTQIPKQLKSPTKLEQVMAQPTLTNPIADQLNELRNITAQPCLTVQSCSSLT